VIGVFKRFAVNDRRVVVRRLSGLDGQRLRGRHVAGSVLPRGPIGVLERAAAGVPRTDVLWDVDAGMGSLLVSADRAEAS
jgi:hypothetical protein